MAESLTLTSEEEDETTEKDKKKFEKRSGSSAKIGASVLEKGAARSAEQPKMSPLDKLLASLLPEKEAKTNQKAKAEGIFARLGNANLEADANEIIEVIQPTRELTSDELSGGEVIIDLRAETPTDVDDGELSVASQPELAEDHEDADDPVVGTATTATRAAAGGSGGGKTPPPSRSTPSSPPPSRPTPSSPRTPVVPRPVMSAPIPGTNFNAAPSPGLTLNQLLSQQRALEQAEYYGRRHGRAEGFLGGVILGGLVEHFRHKSRERKMERLSKQVSQKQEKSIEDLTFKHNLLKTEQLEQIRREEAQRYERKAAAKQELASVARAQMSEAEAIRHAQEVTDTAEEQERKKAALIERLNAQAAHQEQLEAENLLLNPENRIETSAWHAIEVDKAGHAVQDTNINYGHEYYQERGHESGPKDVTTRDSMTGAAALTAASSSQPAQSSPYAEFSAPSMIGMPTQSASVAPSDTRDDDNQIAANTDSAPQTSVAVVIFLLVTLAVVALLIFVLT